ncbi:MAG: hypothetical protein E7255_16055 [Lachnospiraceae bacterium]|nr:hypothetical protein [Lachnospiraceae bacterium]
MAWLSEDNYTTIYLFSGEPIAWISDESIYSFSGHHIGWFQDGWVRDHNGECVFFTQNSIGGPAKPAKQACPARGARWARPARGAREARPARSARSTSWSSLSDEAFLRQ